MRVSLVIAGLVAGCAVAHAQDKLVLDGSTTVGPIAKAFAEAYMRQNPCVNITVSESGSGNGAKALLNGTCDIANLSRALKDSEKKAMEEKGVKPAERVPDNWIYVQDADVEVGRIQVFNNWSPYLVADRANTVWIGLEYFVAEGDKIWSMADADLVALGTREMERIGFARGEDVLDPHRRQQAGDVLLPQSGRAQRGEGGAPLPRLGAWPILGLAQAARLVGGVLLGHVEEAEGQREPLRPSHERGYHRPTPSFFLTNYRIEPIVYMSGWGVG